MTRHDSSLSCLRQLTTINCILFISELVPIISPKILCRVHNQLGVQKPGLGFHVKNSSWAILRQRFTTLLALIQAHSHRTTPRYEEEMESKIRSFLVRFPSLFPPGSAGQSVGLCRWPLLSWHRSFLADVVYMGCYIEQCCHRGKRRRTQQQ